MSEKIKNCVKANSCGLCRSVLVVVIIGLLVAIYLQLRGINAALNYSGRNYAFFAAKRNFMRNNADVHNFVKKGEREFDEFDKKKIREKKEKAEKLPAGEEKFLKKDGEGERVPVEERKGDRELGERKFKNKERKERLEKLPPAEKVEKKPEEKSDKVKNVSDGEVAESKDKNRRERKFVYKMEATLKEKEFIIKGKLPKTFTLEDIAVELKNKNLLIKIEKQNTKSDKNSKSFSYSSFSEDFSLPNTKATLNDIKISLTEDKGGDNELSIIVPIL
jgi:hypothetical protein